MCPLAAPTRVHPTCTHAPATGLSRVMSTTNASRPDGEEVKPDAGESIGLKCTFQDGAPAATYTRHSQPLVLMRCVASGDDMRFKLKKSTPLRKLMNKVAGHRDMSVGALRFVFDGERINGDKSPAAYQMEDGDSIDVMTEQLGGRCADA